MTNTNILIKPLQGAIIRFEDAGFSESEETGAVRIYRGGFVVGFFPSGSFSYVMRATGKACTTSLFPRLSWT